MSASEKLKAEWAAMELDLYGRSTKIEAALPQIVALTEAVEDYVSIPLSRGFALSTAPLRDALTALEEALGGDVT